MMIPYLYIILSCFTICGIARRIVLCEPSDCHNDGTCVGDKCVCAEGFRGSFCEIDKCDEINCRNGGICEQGSCSCPEGFAGKRCQRELKCGLSKPCGNGGTCEDEECLCAEGFRGIFCQIDKCNNRCRNGGTCELGSCSCPAGYAGKRCQDKLTSVECGSSNMTVNIDEQLVLGEASGVHFRNKSCSGVYSSIPNEITLTTDYNQCGTTFEEDNTTITFSNVITYAKPGSEDGTEITREYQLQVKVECCLNKEEDVDGTFRFQLSTSTLVAS